MGFFCVQKEVENEIGELERFLEDFSVRFSCLLFRILRESWREI